MVPHSTAKSHSNGEVEEEEMAGKGGNTIHSHISWFSSPHSAWLKYKKGFFSLAIFKGEKNLLDRRKKIKEM
jgi:hypothetical protein